MTNFRALTKAISRAITPAITAVTDPTSIPARIPGLVVAVGPDFGAVGGSGQLRRIVGSLLTFGLLTAVLMVVVCAAAWAIASSNGSWQSASKAKTGLFVALGGALLTGGALAWANWLLGLGATL